MRYAQSLDQPDSSSSAEELSLIAPDASEDSFDSESENEFQPAFDLIENPNASLNEFQTALDSCMRLYSNNFLFNINDILLNEHSLLSYAAKHSNEAIVEILLRRPNINVNKLIKKGRTALFYAVGSESYEITFALLRCRANPSHADEDGDLPITFATQNSSITRLLLSYGAITLKATHSDYLQATSLGDPCDALLSPDPDKITHVIMGAFSTLDVSEIFQGDFFYDQVGFLKRLRLISIPKKIIQFQGHPLFTQFYMGIQTLKTLSQYKTILEGFKSQCISQEPIERETCHILLSRILQTFDRHQPHTIPGQALHALNSEILAQYCKEEKEQKGEASLPDDIELPGNAIRRLIIDLIFYNLCKQHRLEVQIVADHFNKTVSDLKEEEFIFETIDDTQEFEEWMRKHHEKMTAMLEKRLQYDFDSELKIKILEAHLPNLLTKLPEVFELPYQQLTRQFEFILENDPENSVADNMLRHLSAAPG